VDKDKNINISISRERGTVTGDALNALSTIKDDPEGDKRKFLASALVAGGSLAAATNAAKNLTHRTTLPTQPGSGGAIPLFLGLHGGTYLMFRGDTPEKRYLGAGMAGGSAGLLAYGAKTNYSPKDARNFAILAGGSALLAPAIAATGDFAQRIHNKQEVKRLMESDLPPKDVAIEVNKIREKKTLDTRIPGLRHIERPAAVDSFFEKVIGRPSDQLTPDDYHKYFEIQRIGTERKLKDEFIKEHGKDPDEKEIDFIRTRAHEIVQGKFV
jgi:hypothetical protein